MNDHLLFMQRCIQLAQLGECNTMPNPKVGAVLAYNGKIIGEGYHQQYGKAHAEVNCINSVKDEHKHLIKNAILYISLEPCHHYGKTPPCTQLILEHKIKKVVIGTKDNFELVNGEGIQFLKKQGVEVITEVMHKECLELNSHFFYTNQTQLPYITLKWAESNDGFMNASTQNRTFISNEITSRYIHQVRAQHQAILVGASTFLIDQPLLNNRFYGSKQPIKMILDRHLRIPENFFQKDELYYIINYTKQQTQGHLHFIKVAPSTTWFKNVMTQIVKLGIRSLLVEGGALTHQLLIKEFFFNKIIQIKNESLLLQAGLKAPSIPKLNRSATFTIGNDLINIYQR